MNNKFSYSTILSLLCILLSNTLSSVHANSASLEARDTSSWEAFIQFEYNGSTENLSTEVGSKIFNNFSDKNWLRDSSHNCVQLLSFDGCPQFNEIVIAEKDAVKEYLSSSAMINDTSSENTQSPVSSIEARDTSSWEAFIQFEYNGSTENLSTEVGSKIFNNYNGFLMNEAHTCVEYIKMGMQQYCDFENILRHEAAAVEEYLAITNYAGATSTQGSVDERLNVIKFAGLDTSEQQIVQNQGLMIALVFQCAAKTNIDETNKDLLQINNYLIDYSNVFEYMGLLRVLEGETLFQNSKAEQAYWIFSILDQAALLKNAELKLFEDECEKFITEAAKNVESMNFRGALDKSKLRILDSYDKKEIIKRGASDILFYFTQNLENTLYIIEQERQQAIFANILPNELNLIKQIIDKPKLGDSILSVRGKDLKILSSWDVEIPLVSTQAELTAYTDSTFETKVKKRFRIGSDSQYEAINLIYDASNILRKNGILNNRAEKNAIDDWLINFAEFFNFEEQILLPAGSLFGGEGAPPQLINPFYVNFNDYLVNTKYKSIFKNKFELGAVTISDIRIHVKDFRCVFIEQALCVVPHNQSIAYQNSNIIAGYPLVQSRYIEQITSLQAFPGDLISMDVVIRGFKDNFVGGGSNIYVHPLSMRILEEEKFKLVDLTLE